MLGDHLLLDPAHELPPYTPPPMLSPVRQGSGLFSNVLISGHGPGAHPQLPLTPLTPTPRVLLCRSSESPLPDPGLSPLPVQGTSLRGLTFCSSLFDAPNVWLIYSMYQALCWCWKYLEQIENTHPQGNHRLAEETNA